MPSPCKSKYQATDDSTKMPSFRTTRVAKGNMHNSAKRPAVTRGLVLHRTFEEGQANIVVYRESRIIRTPPPLKYMLVLAGKEGSNESFLRIDVYNETSLIAAACQTNLLVSHSCTRSCRQLTDSCRCRKPHRRSHRAR